MIERLGRYLFVLIIISMLVFYIKTVEASEPTMQFSELDPFQSIQGKVVFVTKNIYAGSDVDTGDIVLRGKVRNVTNQPYKEVYIMWALWDENHNLLTLSIPQNENGSFYGKKNKVSTLFHYKIDYLDSKSEVDFEIRIPLGEIYRVGGISQVEGKKYTYEPRELHKAVDNSFYDVGIYVNK